MEMFVFIVYSALTYWAAGQTIYANKIQIGTMKNIFLNRLVVGILLGGDPDPGGDSEKAFQPLNGRSEEKSDE